MSAIHFMDIESNVKEILTPRGFECYSFKVGWYNDRVSTHFQLPYAYDTLAIVVVSTPAMFDQAFKPFVCRVDCSEDGSRDPIDECIAQLFQKVCQSMPDLEIECIHDFELHHSRRPKVLVQTAGHVAGAAYFYQRTDIVNDPWPSTQQICGVSIHPRYGGWFALRGVIIFKTVLVPDMEQREPPNIVADDERRIELLEQFNFHWQDWSFRNVVPTEATYSEEQKNYFRTPPKQRGALIDKMRSDSGPCSTTTEVGALREW